jgi:hypothetical protein
MDAPPSIVGALQVRLTSVLPKAVVTEFGADGTVRGITAVVSGEAGEVPATLVAVTEKV